MSAILAAITMALSLFGCTEETPKVTILEYRYTSEADGGPWVWRIYRDESGRTIRWETVKETEI